MSTWIIDEISNGDDVLDKDIYDLAWYTLYLIEIHNKPFAKQNINNIYLILKTFTEEKSDLLHIILYDKEVAIGILLGCYILLRSGYNENHINASLSKVLKVIKDHIDEYSAYGEILYVLKKLDTITDTIRKFINIDDRMRIRFNDLKDIILKGNLRIEDAENLLYIIWAIYETKAYDIAEDRDLLKTVVNDRLYDLIVIDQVSASIYANAVSSFILKHSLKFEKEIHDKLYERIEALYKMLKHYAEMLEQKNENISKALISKIRLGIYNLEGALQKLKDLDEVQRIKRKYYLTLAILVAVMIIFINILPLMDKVLISFLISYLISYRSIISSVLITVLAFIFDKIFEGKISKWILEFLKNILKLFILEGKHIV